MNEKTELSVDSLEKRIQRAHLTKGQHRIADYFLKNQNRICNMTSLAIAKEIGVSDASVIRFSRAIGYAGFTELKENLYALLVQDLTNLDIGNFAPAQRLDFQINEFKSLDLAEEFLKLMTHNIEQSVRQNNPYLCERAVDILVKSRRKLVVGVQGSKGSAIQFARLLGFLLDRVELLTTGESDELASLRGLGKEDALVAISYARYYKTDAYLANLAHRAGAMVIVLADSIKSPWAQVADVLFLVETKHLGFFNSILGTSGLLEYLITLMCWKYPVQCGDCLKERDQIVSPLLLDN